MGFPINASHHDLVNMANNECGYRNVFVDYSDSARRSNAGNLVVEHNNRGSEDVCRGGRVVSHEGLQGGDVYQPRYTPRSSDVGVAVGLGLLGGALLSAALSPNR